MCTSIGSPADSLGRITVCVFRFVPYSFVYIDHLHLQLHLYAAAFNTLRVWAIWGRHWFPVLVVFPFAVIPPLMNAVSTSIPVPISLGITNPIL